MNKNQINPVKEITKPLLQELRERINDALSSICDEYGLQSLKAGNANYDALGFSFKLEGKILVEGSESASKMNTKLSEAIGYSKNIIGSNFSMSGEEWTVDSINLKKFKRPIIVKKKSNGKLYEFPNDSKLPLSDSSINWSKPLYY